MIVTVALLAAGTSPAAPPRTQIVYATCVTNPQVWREGEEAVLRRFMAAHPQIEVVARQIPFESYDTQILLSARAGRPPDVARINHSTLRTWAGAGYLAPLDDFIAGSTVIQPEDYWPGFWNICRVDGVQYAVPLGTDCRVLAYNRRMFQRMGIPPPPRSPACWTWAEFVEAARNLQDEPARIYGVGFAAGNEWSALYDAVGTLLVANGGFLLSEDGRRATVLSDPRTVQALRLITDLVTRDMVCPPGMANMTGEVLDALFAGERLGMMINGPWLRENMRRLRPEWVWDRDYGLALIPAGPATGTTGSAQGGWLIGVFSGSKHHKEAMLLLEFLSRPESLATVAAVENLPPRRAAMSLGPFADPYYRVFFDQLPYARPPCAVIPQLPMVARAVQRAYQRTVSGRSSPEEAARWLQDRLENHLLR